jgi:hypothetical protein
MYLDLYRGRSCQDRPRIARQLKLDRNAQLLQPFWKSQPAGIFWRTSKEMITWRGWCAS